MRNINLIDTSLAIGDTLATINQSYLDLDKWTTSVQSSAVRMWAPLLDLFTERQEEWRTSYTLAQQNSAKWISMSSTVELNSAKWLTPLSLYYPGIFPLGTGVADIRDVVDTWLNNYFPVTSDFLRDPIYVENQVAVIYNFYSDPQLSTAIDRTEVLIDRTTCTTADVTAYANCRTDLFGVAFCSNGDMSCDGQYTTCPQTASTECYYNTYPFTPYIMDDGYYTRSIAKPSIITVDANYNTIVTNPPPEIITEYGTDGNKAFSSIQATLYIKYNDTREHPTINGLRFKVKNCRWTFDSVIR